ncbi:MAG: efflux RND transporter periplasmic adaptor subunit [Acetobacteraceae bacterium]|nr:efflux RND transporter periplasmic adaptor subunit [Acetobacteraceae bacterium]
MTHLTTTEPETDERTSVTRGDPGSRRRGRRGRRALLAAGTIAAMAAAAGGLAWEHGNDPVAPPPPPPPQVAVSAPLRETVTTTTGFLGQFSAVDAVELRAQVGGTLTSIDFQDGQVVHKGDQLFTIDPRPYQIKLDQAVAQFQTAQAKETLAAAELWRAQQLKQTNFGSAETLDERAADQRSAQAAIDTAKADIMDARLDLEFARVTAPFTGRMGAHLVSVGSLVSGSRGGTGPTTLLATINSLDPIHLDFDMSEADYIAWRRLHPAAAGQPDGEVRISLDGDGSYGRRGTLDFVDNALDRSSGTVHARATVPNPDLSITPGEFARLRLVTGKPAPALLVPASAVMPDQSDETVMTVARDGTVVPKQVQTGDLYRGLRIIRSGLQPTDRVIIDGLMRARPGAKVTPVAGAIEPDAASGSGAGERE